MTNDLLFSRLFARIRDYIDSRPGCVERRADYREASFGDYSFMLYDDNSFVVSVKFGHGASVLLEIEGPGSVICHANPDRLLNELLPALERALLLDDLAGIE